jgi:predicted nucleic acid-binding protein
MIVVDTNVASELMRPARRAALATRNLADFREKGVEVIDPWRPGG